MATMTAEPTGVPVQPGAHPQSFISKYIFSTDHKVIGIQFLFTCLFFLLVGGLLAVMLRYQLGFPDQPMPGSGLLPETILTPGQPHRIEMTKVLPPSRDE